MNFESFLIEFQKAKDSQKPFVVVTLVGHKGSVPQIMGARLIVSEAGYFSGTVGGGKLEKATIEKAKAYLNSNQSTFFHEWNLQTDLGMSCGGVVSLFFEVHHPRSKWHIVIFGAGHVSQELTRVLLRLNCRLTCVDSRGEWLEKLPSDPKLEKILQTHVPDYVGQLVSDDQVVIATMGHATDLPILQKILSSDIDLKYLGVLGSDLKAGKLRNNILEAGLSQKKTQSFYCPIGESIGDNTPAEMAISIVSQLLKARGSSSQKEDIK